MTSARAQIREALIAALPNQYRVVVPRNLDPLEARTPTIVVIPDTITPTGNRTHRDSTFALHAITPKMIDPDEDLDVIVSTVLDALENIPWLLWIDAERTTFQDLHSYRIRVQTKTLIERKPTHG
ncbi:hypothetical protein [Mycetocola saprophilus]|uniref:hypothetical protein n=1 Tax=Mycetocola saprophilus TaxID=76636 RepID=UPI003BF0F7DE